MADTNVSQDDLLARIRAEAESVERRAIALEAVTMRRDRLIVEASSLSVSNQRIGDAAGLSEGRVRQIVKKRPQ